MPDRQSYYVGVKAIVTNSNNQVLILKDTSNNGKWELIGGRIDKDDEIEATLAREVQEEIPGATLNGLDEIIYAAQGDFIIEDEYKLLLLFYKADIKLPGNIKLSAEHSDQAWVNIVALDDYDIYTTDKAAILKYLKDEGN